MELTTVENNDAILQGELFFLIAKFLSNSPFKDVAQALIKKLEESHLPHRLDWTGQIHQQGFEELAAKHPHIGPNHLLEICARLPSLLERDGSLTPTVAGIISLLGAGRQNLLRTTERVSRPRSIREYCARSHGAPLLEALNRKNSHNIVNVLYGRQSSGPLVRRQAVPTTFYSKAGLLRQTLGHLSAVYCVLFDRTGKYIVTGADDLLVKLWSAIDGRLLTTFRGASAEITDIAINLENTMLAAGSLDRVLRVWDLQTASVIAVLCAHNGMITSVNFCPNPKTDMKYLVTTSTDGSVAFWQYSQSRGQKPIFQPKPTQYHEKLRPGQAQMICASFSPGGVFLAAGSADHHVRVYNMGEDGPKRILEIDSHTDTVDSIQWAHSGLKFVSGSKDGTALLWRFETQQWKFEKLNMTDRLATCPPSEGVIDPKKGLKVTMVSWDRSDSWIVTAVNDHSIKVWNSKTAKLHNVLRGHTDELYVLESHPKDAHVLLSAGHDGQIFLWDIYKGEKLASFVNNIEGQGHGGIFDAKWSPDGTIIAATDSHGHILMYGFGSGHARLKEMPKELFFHTDYRPLIRDANYYVLDEQTQLVPHLMPPPFLVDVDGNPYPPSIQKLVPGRENCPSDQLIPDNIGEGFGEAEGARSEIDLLIEALANRQNNQNVPEPAENENQDRRASLGASNRSNVQASPASRPNVSIRDQNTLKYTRRMLVKPVRGSNLSQMKQIVYYAGVHEMDLFRREMKKRPLMINTGNPNNSALNGPPKKNARGGRKRRVPGESPGNDPGPSGNSYNTTNMNNRTTTTRGTTGRPHRPHLDDDDEALTSSSETSNSSDSTAVEEDLNLSGSSSSDSDSSDYSDWIDVEDQQKLEPPKRSKRKPVERRTFSPTDSDSGRKAGPKGAKLLPNGEIPDEYKPPEWLSEVIPKKAPYYPQMGDEVVYFRQGHERYFECVKNKKLYQLTGKFEPWQQLELREHEFCKVIGIKYEIRPPRLCCLKLALMTDDGNMTDRHFTIKYHDIADVIDFIVLKHTFDTAIRRNWGPSDRFRCMIDDKWWIGQIEGIQALQEEFPDSLFMCFRVRWDNSEFEFMSPWDMEPIDEERMPNSVGGSVMVLPEEIQATLYRPKKEEWPRGDREGSCRRIVAGLQQVMELAIADVFLTPVDLNAYPTYAFVVEYPIDLSTIKARFENHFYRRITSAQFDVRYLATNAEKFNEKHSNIVKHARIITDLCLRILRDHNEVDVPAVYHQFQDTYVSSASEDESRPGPSTSRAGPSTSRAENGSRRSRRFVPTSSDWRMQCRELLQLIWNHNDSEPFRLPVDLVEIPDYLQIVDTPMDLQTVKEELLSGNYESPIEFAKDMRLIFQNSRNYNTNNRSRIYTMTLRMCELFEDHVKTVISQFKSAKKRSENRGSPSKKKNARPTRSNGAGPSTSQNHHNSGDSDDDDEDHRRNGKVNGRSRRTHAQSNGVSSSSNMKESQQGANKRSRTTRTKSSVDDETNSSESSSESSNSDESSGIPIAALGQSSTSKALRKTFKKKKSQQKRGAVSSSSTKKTSRNAKRHKAPSNDEQQAVEHTEDESQSARSNSEPKTSRRSNRNAPNRIIKSSSDDDDDKQPGDDRQKRVSRRPKRYESDQSFHVEGTSKKVADSDSDKPRATRESAKKKFLEWALTSEDNDDDDEDFDQKPQTTSQAQKSAARRSNRKKVIRSDSDNSDEKKSKPVPSRKSTRAQRASQSQSQEESDDSNEPNQPTTSTSTNVRGTRVTNGQSQPQTSSMSSSRTTRSSQQQPSIESRGNNDHNYGEPGPSSSASAPPRQTRSTILSRHQRNADELDRSGLEDSSLVDTSQSGRLARLRSANLRVTPTQQSFEALNGIRRTMRARVMHNYFEDENDNDAEEGAGLRHLNQQRPTRQEPLPNDPSDDSDSYSEEDKTPLKLMATSSSKKALAHEHNTRNGTAAVNRVKRNLYSDDEQQAGTSNSRSATTRNSKRPHYNEETDEEKVSRGSRRNVKQRRVQSQSSENERTSDEEDEPSVSSRGRVRKVSKRYNC